MLLNDVRYALRSFAKNPGFAAAAVLSLAIGIGANTSVFSVASALLLHPLPYKDADRLVILWNRSPGLNIAEDWFSTGQYFDINSYVSGLTFTPTPGLFTLTPCRLIDTRLPAGLFGGPALAAGANRVFTVVGQCGIPAGAKAISSNVTITQPTAPGHVILFPGGIVPGVSNLNFRAGQTRANNAIVPLSATGSVSVTDGQSSGTTHFILDVNGYFQ